MTKSNVIIHTKFKMKVVVTWKIQFWKYKVQRRLLCSLLSTKFQNWNLKLQTMYHKFYAITKSILDAVSMSWKLKKVHFIEKVWCTMTEKMFSWSKNSKHVGRCKNFRYINICKVTHVLLCKNHWTWCAS